MMMLHADEFDVFPSAYLYIFIDLPLQLEQYLKHVADCDTYSLMLFKNQVCQNICSEYTSGKQKCIIPTSVNFPQQADF